MDFSQTGHPGKYTFWMVPIVCHPDDLIVIVGGGAGGKSMFLPTAGAQSLSVTRLIETGE